MFGCGKPKESKTKEAVVCEIVRTLGRMESTPAIAAYQKTIFELAASIYPVAATKASVWMTKTIENASLADAPALAVRIDELRSLLRHHPEFVFSLLVGLATAKGENYAWAIAYG